MTDNEIKCEKCFHQSVCEKKTCAECQGSYCDECELYNLYNGKPYIENCEKFVDADLINRQQAEIEKNEKIIKAANDLIDVQKTEIERLQTNIVNVKLTDEQSNAQEQEANLFNYIKAEAIEEFVYRLQMECGTFNNGYYRFADYEIDNLKEKMVGDAE